MFCTNCGKPIDPKSKFCEACGAKNRRAFEQQQPRQAPQQPAPQSQYQAPQPQYQAPPQYAAQPVATAVKTAAKAGMSAGKIIGIVSGVVAVLAIVVVMVFHFGLLDVFKSDETLIEERIEDLEKAYNDFDMDGILDCFDTRSRIAAQGILNFTDGLIGQLSEFGGSLEDMMGLGALAGNGNNFQIRVLLTRIEGNNAIVDIEITTHLMYLDNTQSLTIPMVKEDGDWYIGGTEEDIGNLLSGIGGY